MSNVQAMIDNTPKMSFCDFVMPHLLYFWAGIRSQKRYFVSKLRVRSRIGKIRICCYWLGTLCRAVVKTLTVQGFSVLEVDRDQA